MTYSRVKRVICLLLSICLLLQLPLSVYADGPNANDYVSVNRPGKGGGGDGKGNVTKTYGYRVSLAPGRTLSEDGIGKLEGQYTRDDLFANR